MSRQRGAARGAASFLTETLGRVRNAGATGLLTVRADSAFHVDGAGKSKRRLTSASRSPPGKTSWIRAAIDAISEPAWQPIPSWLSNPEVSGADIAETPFTVFAPDKRDARPVRLVVRRIRPTPGSQLALFTAWDYHAVITDRDLPLAEVEADHRRHAIVEQTIAEPRSAGLAHLPSGHLMANAAWLALTVMTHNSAEPSGSSPAPTSRGRPPRRCAARCSPCPAGLCIADDEDTYDYLPLGPGPTRSCARGPGVPPPSRPLQGSVLEEVLLPCVCGTRTAAPRC